MPREPGEHPEEAQEETDVDEESEESFPASDPPSHWSGSSEAGSPETRNRGARGTG